jgi:hypothetical protein
MCVAFNVILVTVQLFSHADIQSPILNGLENKIDREENVSSNMCCKAKAIAIHHSHKLAMIGVISIHKLVNINNIPITHTITFTVVCIIVCVLFSISACFLNMLFIEYHRILLVIRMTCNTMAIINITSMILSIMLGRLRNFSGMYISKIEKKYLGVSLIMLINTVLRFFFFSFLNFSIFLIKNFTRYLSIK